MWIEPLKFLTEQYPATMFTYSTSALRSLLKSMAWRPVVTSGVWSRIKGLGINKRQRWKRGGTCCKWKRAQKPQPVVHNTAQECRSADKCKQYSGITIKDNKRSEF